MSATFPCPHCGATYPRKPVLVGKVVRCTACKKPFRLREDGQADALSDAPTVAPAAPPAPVVPAAPTRPMQPTAAPSPQAAPTPTPASPLPPPSGAARAVVGAVPTTSPSATPTPPPAVGVKGRSARMKAAASSERFEQARRDMAATLAGVASKVVAEEAAKEAAKPVEEKSDAPASKGSSRFKRTKTPGAEGQVGKISPAVLTGEGERLQEERRLTWLIAVGAILVIAGIVWLTTRTSPERDALRAFTAAVEGKDNQHPYRVAAIQKRAWLIALAPGGSGVSAFVGLDDASLGAARSFDPGPAKAAIAGFVGLADLVSPAIWVPAGDFFRARAAVAGLKDANLALRKLAEMRIAAMPGARAQRRLVDAGLSEEDADVVLAFLRGISEPDGSNRWAAMLLKDGLPSRIEVRPFHGRAGDLLVDPGRPPYRTVAKPYHGLLVRCSGAGWPSDWRILDLRAE